MSLKLAVTSQFAKQDARKPLLQHAPLFGTYMVSARVHMCSHMCVHAKVCVCIPECVCVYICTCILRPETDTHHKDRCKEASPRPHLKTCSFLRHVSAHGMVFAYVHVCSHMCVHIQVCGYTFARACGSQSLTSNVFFPIIYFFIHVTSQSKPPPSFPSQSRLYKSLPVNTTLNEVSWQLGGLQLLLSSCLGFLSLFQFPFFFLPWPL